MEKIMQSLINNWIRGVDTYTHNGSTWLIFTDSKRWVIELTEDKTLWYNYNFFKQIFSLTSLDVVENQQLITKWVEDNVMNKVKDTRLEINITEGEVDDIIQDGVKETFNFDENQYLFNQQINFNSYIFSQNGTATYANAGLGAYGQLNLTSTLQLAAGLQNASDISGDSLTIRNFSSGGYAWFAYAQWTPRFKGLGSAQYSILRYQVPSVPAQAASQGWSFNAVQNLNTTWALFARANQADAHLTPIRRSFALGAA
jgi:hypothetical protein